MNFTREPIIETVITPREGCKLVVRSSKANGQEDYFVDAVEVVSFGHSFFFRSSEKPKSFLVPVSDYEILELRETRMVLKHVPSERSVKIGGGRDSGPPRAHREAQSDNRQESISSESVDEETPPVAEAGATPAEPRSDRNKRDRRRRGRRGRSDRPLDQKDSSAAPIEGTESAEDSVGPVSQADETPVGEKPVSAPPKPFILFAPPPLFKRAPVAPKVPEDIVHDQQIAHEQLQARDQEDGDSFPEESIDLPKFDE